MIYLFDEKEKLVKIVNRKAIKNSPSDLFIDH